MLRMLPLGGLGEVGMNCMALEQRGDVVLIDCGVTFDDRGLGVDVVHPDFSALSAFGGILRGVVITHGHEDHIGALPYLLRRYDVPVWAPPYALGLVRERLGEHEVLAHARLLTTRPGERFEVGSFGFEPIRVTHSIADATALAIDTDEGTVIHTGDFKIDPSPIDGEAFDEARLSALGDRGVTLLMSDSTNIDAEGDSGSEVGVGEALEELVADAPSAVIVAMFASNVHRLRLLGEIAARAGRRIVLLGRGVGTHARVARGTGYLPWPDDYVWPDARARELPRNKILAIATGSQGEERAALARLARGDHPTFDVAPGDRVILSARTIPGNEPEVHAILGLLLRRGCDVRSRLTDRAVHVSGHAHRNEQRRMLSLVRPRSFVPVHGTLHHLKRHGELGAEMGVRDVVVIENGRVCEVTREGLALGEILPTGRVHVFAGKELPTTVLRERSFLAEEGVASCSVILGPPGEVHVSIATRGVVDEDAFGDEVDALEKQVRRAVLEMKADATDDEVRDHVRLTIRRSFAKARGFKPMTMVHLHRHEERS